MKRIRNIFFTFIAVGMIAASPDGYRVGDTVGDFRLKGTDGKMIGLSDYRDSKGVIVIFDCNTCPFSKAYNERIIALHEKYASKGFPVIAINPNDPQVSPGDSFQEMARIAKEKNYEFPYLMDETQNVARAFGATNTPHVFVLKREGTNFRVAYIGAIDNSPRNAASADKRYVEDAVNALLDGKEIRTAKTKAVGCGIKWKDA